MKGKYRPIVSAGICIFYPITITPPPPPPHVLAELWVPVQRVDVEQHGAAGVGHICAVHPPGPPPGQTLDDQTTTTVNISFPQ
jgi:hypothetical protein